MACINLRAFSLPGTIRAGLENHRAAASRDFEDDERDLARRLRCPVLTLRGEFGKVHGLFGVLATWQEKADAVEGPPAALRALHPRRGARGAAGGPAGLLARMSRPRDKPNRTALACARQVVTPVCRTSSLLNGAPGRGR